VAASYEYPSSLVELLTPLQIFVYIRFKIPVSLYGDSPFFKSDSGGKSARNEQASMCEGIKHEVFWPWDCSIDSLSIWWDG